MRASFFPGNLRHRSWFDIEGMSIEATNLIGISAIQLAYNLFQNPHSHIPIRDDQKVMTPVSERGVAQSMG